MKKIMQTLLFSVTNERGAAKIIVAFSIIALLGFTALVVDVGAVYFEKSRLQKALDAAVLGGAQRLLVSQNEAKDTAKDIASKNGFTIADAEVETEAQAIEIEKTINKQMTFAKILGIDDTDIYAVARAELIQSALVQKDGIVPVGPLIGDYQAGNQYELNFSPGNGNRGNYGFLALEGNGAAMGETIRNGSEATYKIGDEVLTEPGLSWGIARPAFQYRIDQDANKQHCQVFETADFDCKRVIIIPLIQTYEDANGRDVVKISGFAAVWIEKVGTQSNHVITGRFIDFVTGGIFDDNGTETNLYRVKLVK
ncbi:pilus assembly protein TadG-related protein [Sporosarcina sp. UB5]|uniref:pilus assembly protein TadG-related protein n=1 Tax=Sporosarcina sp. UB5 TaxID=3047463 RepID=UPI003D797FAC